MSRPRICITIDWYLPGTNSGGPVRSIANLVGNLPELDFYILTRNHDYCAKEPYRGIPFDTWIQQSTNVWVHYFSADKLSKNHLERVLEAIKPDTLYISGIYSKAFSIWPVYLSKKLNIPAIVAARGMLSAHALAVKPVKKRIFLQWMRWTNAYKHVLLHATSPEEKEDIQRAIGKHQGIIFIPNLPRLLPAAPPPIIKEAGKLHLVSLGRIAPEKGTLEGIKALQNIKGEIEYNLYGTCYDQTYWDICMEIIADLPSHIRVKYHGSLHAESYAFMEAIHAAHALLMPSKGENYGHAIVECLSQGKPVIISKKTPWQELERANAGFDVAAESIAQAVQCMVDSDQQRYNQWSSGAAAYFRTQIEKNSNADRLSYQQMLSQALISQ